MIAKYWVIIKDDIINVFCGINKIIPPGSIEISKEKMNQIISGQNIKYYKKDFIKKSESELISEGIIIDNRGTYYNKENHEPLIIKKLDIKKPDNYTKIVPTSKHCTWNDIEWIDDKEKIKNDVIEGIKTAAREIIINKYPEWKQANLQARFSELIDKDILTPEENQEKNDIKSVWNWVKKIRNKSDIFESELNNLSIEQIKSYNVDFGEV